MAFIAKTRTGEVSKMKTGIFLIAAGFGFLIASLFTGCSTSGLIPLASLYRATLRQYFGELAENNHEVTMAAVAAYFLQKYATQTLTQADGDARDMLLFGFQQLTGWSGTDNTWSESIPWEIVP